MGLRCKKRISGADILQRILHKGLAVDNLKVQTRTTMATHKEAVETMETLD